MARAKRNLLTTVKTEGGLLPPDFLQRLVEARLKAEKALPRPLARSPRGGRVAGETRY
jgi:hypothetical protein